MSVNLYIMLENATLLYKFVTNSYCPTCPYEGLFFILSLTSYEGFSFISTVLVTTSAYTGAGWGLSEEEGSRCSLFLFLFPFSLIWQQEVMSAVRRAPAEKDTMKMAMEIPTTVPALIPPEYIAISKHLI